MCMMILFYYVTFNFKVSSDVTFKYSQPQTFQFTQLRVDTPKSVDAITQRKSGKSEWI